MVKEGPFPDLWALKSERRGTQFNLLSTHASMREGLGFHMFPGLTDRCCLSSQEHSNAAWWITKKSQPNIDLERIKTCIEIPIQRKFKMALC